MLGVHSDRSKVKVGIDKVRWIVINEICEWSNSCPIRNINFDISLTNTSRRASRGAIYGAVTSPIPAWKFGWIDKHIYNEITYKVSDW